MKFITSDLAVKRQEMTKFLYIFRVLCCACSAKLGASFSPWDYNGLNLNMASMKLYCLFVHKISRRGQPLSLHTPFSELQWFVANGTIQIRCTQVTIGIDRRSVALSAKKSLFVWQKPQHHFSPHIDKMRTSTAPIYIFVNSGPELKSLLLLKWLFLISGLCCTINPWRYPQSSSFQYTKHAHITDS